MIRLLTFLLLTVLPALGLPVRLSHAPTSEGSLVTYLASPEEHRLTLGKDIRVTKPMLVPEQVEIVGSLHYLVYAGGTITFNGKLDSNRKAVFVGFPPGAIRGTFGGEPKQPEWWFTEFPGHDDVAIQCAVDSTPKLTGNIGHVVSLAAKRYLISSDIRMGGTYTRLTGAGGTCTLLDTVAGWKPARWMTTNKWPAVEGGNHAGVVVMGSAVQNDASFHSVVEGISINCYEAAIAHYPRRVSALTTYSCIEENSRIVDVRTSYTTGCGIGFPPHAETGWVPTINGLHIESVWVTGPMCADGIPILFPQHAANFSLGTFTVDMGLHKSESSAYGDVAPELAEDKGIYPRPRWIRNWPRVGIEVGGSGIIQAGHFEGMTVPVRVVQNSGSKTVKVSGIKLASLMDSHQLWVRDGRSNDTGPAPEYSGLYDYSCGVLLDSSDWDLERNLKDHVIVENVIAYRFAQFLMRDKANSLHVSAYGQGQFPQTPTGGLTLYARGDAFKANNYTLVR